MAGRRRVGRTTFVVAAAVLAVSLAAGTAAVLGSPGADKAAAPPAATPAGIACPADLAVPDGAPRLAADFSPVAVTVCRDETRRRADGGLDLITVELRGDRVAELTAALRLPDLDATRGACRTMLRRSVGWFALHDAGGRSVRPRAPLDECGNARREAAEAFAALPLTRVADTVVRELESAGAAAAGCAQDWKNMIAIDAPTARPGRGADLVGDEVRICVYRVGADTGQFVRGELVDRGERRTAIGRALAAAGPAGECTRTAERFAVLRPPSAEGAEVYVELDGCNRVLLPAPDGAGRLLAQAGPRLIRLIDEP
ncbi:hypothetical protein [Phytohabitans houttuyneae]|uniref:hypothetical protein n=1 Tax=Phytohabitans houttuyneae TaxID=1076126 RepID=UPI0031E5F2DD